MVAVPPAGTLSGTTAAATCNSSTRVLTSRDNNAHRVRYRECTDCGFRMKTIELTDEDYMDLVDVYTKVQEFWAKFNFEGGNNGN